MSSEAPAPRRPRATLVPNANNPALLLRLVQLVASGIRRQRALAEVLDVELRTVHYYTQAGEWLGLLDTERDVCLTRRGLELAVAEPARRRRLYAEAIWRNRLVRALMTGRTSLPENEVIAEFIAAHEPLMAEHTALRRASALRGLIEPALAYPPTSRQPEGEQLLLPFLAQAPVTTPVTGFDARPVDLRAGTEDNPDIYARLLRVLLDHGELTTGQVRAVLDRVGAQDSPLGAYADMAVRRGDARRQGDRLVVTPGAVKRRELALQGLLVALSDPDYRAWLALLQRAPDAQDPELRRDLSRLSARFAHWDRRYFGQRLQPDTVGEALAGALPGRAVDGIPLAGHGGPEPAQVEGPFLDNLDQEGLVVCFPAVLSQLAGQVSGVNELLAAARAAPAGVRLPTVVDPRVTVHGGLVAPGETLPRAVPDNLSLRLRCLTHVPALGILAALLLMDRRPDVPVKLVARGEAVELAWRGKRRIPLDAALVEIAQAQGWLVSRGPTPAPAAPQVVGVAEALGILVRVGRRVVLDEALFARLQEDPEAHLVFDAMQPLQDRILAWLGS